MAGQATVTIRDKQWAVSLAVTPCELASGLGNIPQIPLQTGMLFDVGTTRTIQVTTVPMLLPLDIAFLSDTLVVTEVYRNIEPGYLVTSTLPARYFLEVNAGELDGVAAGDRASVEVIVPAQSAVPDRVAALSGFMGMLVAGILALSMVKTLVKGLLEEPERPALLPQAERKAKEWKRHWFDRGVQAGRTDGWMDVENTLQETARTHPGLKDARELVWTDIDLWEETDHFNILYGSKMWQDARGDTDLYLDLKSQFWEGYLSGRKQMGRDIYRIAEELVRLPAADFLPQTAGRRGEVLYTVNLASPGHAEKVVLENGTARLQRYLEPVVRFRPTEEQRRRIQSGKGYLHIFSGQILQGKERLPLRPQAARELPRPQGKPLVSEILQGLSSRDSYRAYVRYPEDKSAFVTIGAIIGGHYSWNPAGFTVWVDAWERNPEWPPDHILAIKELRRPRTFEATEEGVRKALEYVETEFPSFTGTMWVSRSIPIYVAHELGIMKKEAAPEWLPGVVVMPKIPDEAKKDVLFVQYIHDLVRLGERVTDEEAKLMWEAWKKRELSRLPYNQLIRQRKDAARPAVIPREKRPRGDGELEFLPDSPEFLAYTIDDIGYREKIDSAFQQAVARAKRSK